MHAAPRADGAMTGCMMATPLLSPTAPTRGPNWSTNLTLIILITYLAYDLPSIRPRRASGIKLPLLNGSDMHGFDFEPPRYNGRHP